MKKYLPPYKAALLTVIVVVNALVYWGAMFLTAGKYHYDIQFAFEQKIPFLPWTISIYYGCYLFWVVNYIMAVQGDEKETLRFVIAELAGKVVCFLFFVFFPTTMPRPEVAGNSLGQILVRNMYKIDPATNLFPSIHCFASWMSYIGVRGKKWVPRWYQNVSCIIAIAVFITVLTVKQHVIVDVIAGYALAEFTFFLSGKFISKHNSLHCI